MPSKHFPKYLLFFLINSQAIFAQQKTTIEAVDDFIIENKLTPAMTGTANPFSGKTIGTAEKNDWIYFVNDKYYIYRDYGQNNLGAYKIVQKGGAKTAVLLEDGDIRGFVVPKNATEFWYNKKDYSDIENYKILPKNYSDADIEIQGEKVYDLNTAFAKFYIRNGRIGFKKDDKKVLKEEADSLDFYGDMAIVFARGKKDIYNSEGISLTKNLKAYYKYSTQTFQIIDSENQMSFIDVSGKKHKAPPVKRFLMGNDTDASEIVSYEIIKEKIFKSIYHPRRYYRNDTLEIPLDNILEKVELPKKYSKPIFINNEKKIEAEDYWYYVGFYRPLPPYYVVMKSRGKYGVLDMEEKKEIIPFNYNKIIPKSTHLFLVKKSLITCYPYIGTAPKYKILGEFTEYFAHYEYPDGRKGWVDRKGIEYPD